MEDFDSLDTGRNIPKSRGISRIKVLLGRLILGYIRGMQVLPGFKAFPADIPGTVVTLGNFDGVHRGHQELLISLTSEAKAFSVPSVVVTFDPHPVQVLYPDRKLEKLFDSDDQFEQLSQWGVDYCLVQKFSKEFSEISAEDFLQDYLFKTLRPKTLVVGHDFSFGNNRQGQLKDLEVFCSAQGIKLIIIPPLKLDGRIVSSSRIREGLKSGQLEDVLQCLKRPYYYKGQVVKGLARGRTIGVPTANIEPLVSFQPKYGVYFCDVWVIKSPQEIRKCQGITNIGVNPTVGHDLKLKVETHLFDFFEDIYGVTLRVELKKFHREEKKFSDFQVLKEQIHLDIQSAKDYFAEVGES